MSELAVTLGLAFVISAYYLFTKDLLAKPLDSLNQKIWKQLRFRDLAVFLNSITGFMLIGFLEFLIIISDTFAYQHAVEVFFTAFAYMFTGFFVGYYSIYVIYRINQELMGVYPTRKQK